MALAEIGRALSEMMDITGEKTMQRIKSAQDTENQARTMMGQRLLAFINNPEIQKNPELVAELENHFTKLWPGSPAVKKILGLAKEGRDTAGKLRGFTEMKLPGMDESQAKLQSEEASGGPLAPISTPTIPLLEPPPRAPRPIQETMVEAGGIANPSAELLQSRAQKLWKTDFDFYVNQGMSPEDSANLASQKVLVNNKVPVDKTPQLTADELAAITAEETSLGRALNPQERYDTLLKHRKAFAEAGFKPDSPAKLGSYQDVEIIDPNSPGGHRTVLFDPDRTSETSGKFIDPETKQVISGARRYYQPAASLQIASGQDVNTYAEALGRGEITPAQVPQGIRDEAIKAAHAKGYQLLSDSERQAITAFDSASTIVDDIAKYADKINVHEGIKARTSGAERVAKSMAGYDPDVSALRSKKGELALLIRALGEKGTLAEGDVNRAIALIPSPSDTKTEKDNKINDLRGILKRARGAKVSAATQPVKSGASNIIEQRNKKTGEYRHSTDGGKTWTSGRAPK